MGFPPVDGSSKAIFESMSKSIFSSSITSNFLTFILGYFVFKELSFSVLVPVPNNQSKIDWSVEGEKMKNLVIDKMEKDLMPNLRENIVEDFYLTPDYFEKDLNTKHGSGFSIQPKFSQSAYFRFHNKSEIFNGLYFFGAGTNTGAGVTGEL